MSRAGQQAPRVVDLFCGSGGLTLGLVDAGFESVQAFDNWPAAVETFRRNIGDHVGEFDLADSPSLPRCDVIAGGPPCQGFSSAGRRNADDERNSLVRAFASITADHRPKAFVFENVEGFLTTGRGSYVRDLLEPLLGAGYLIHLRKVNAANFGVPQHRKRVVAIGGLGFD
ncbi:MAG: DNA (cytosine-5-)-methyltransferase, partial [Planctomycetota bacterium]